jgi:hypothetical protein
MVYLIGKGIKGAERDGYPTGRFHEHLRMFRQVYEFGVPAGMSRSGLGETTLGPGLGKYGCDDADEIGTAEAATISGFSRRHCQRLASSGLGRRVGQRGWVLDRAGFIAHLAENRKGTDDHRSNAA